MGGARAPPGPLATLETVIITFSLKEMLLVGFIEIGSISYNWPAFFVQ